MMMMMMMVRDNESISFCQSVTRDW